MKQGLNGGAMRQGRPVTEMSPRPPTLKSNRMQLLQDAELGVSWVKEPFLFKVVSLVPKLNLSGSYEKKEEVFSGRFCVC